jgi:AcrR family transcriptional regulator
MSKQISRTLGGKRRKETTPRDAEASRNRILEAAKLRFSQSSYEGVGVREIAADAGVDPALVMRYFGSKESLFREIASRTFDTNDILIGSTDALPENAATIVMGKLDDNTWRTGYDPLRLLLASIGSPTAGPILSEYLDRDFIVPITASLRGRDANERGAMIAAEILGLALVRAALASSRTEKKLHVTKLKRIFIEALKSLK